MLDRPRVRGDLQWTFSPRSSLQASTLWIAFDPITRQCFRFGEVEYWLIQQMRGRFTLKQIREKFDSQFSEKEFSTAELLTFCQHLRNRQLLHSDIPSDPARTAARNRIFTSWFNPSSWVSWRARGINVDPFLSWLSPYCGWIFSRSAVVSWLAVCFSVLVLVLLDFPRLVRQTVGWDWLFQPTLLGSLFFVFLATRALHELGHALACKRFGIRCPDIGVFIVLGAPCVYCDVSESWRLPAAWQRAAVAAAGMYVELIVAALAALVWLATVDNSLNTIALQTMLICSVSTLLINANPLMRFDGYYILSDLTNEASLRTRADEACLRELYLWLLGQPAVAEKPIVSPALRRRCLVAFSAAGWIYRASLTLVIATVLVSLYESWNLPWFGRFLAVSILVTWWGFPMLRLSQGLLRTAWRVGKLTRLSLATAIVTVAIFLLPIPGRRTATGWLQPSQLTGLYAPTTGQLMRITARDGQTVTAGNVVFELDDYQARIAALSLDSSAKQAAARLSAAKRNQYFTSIDLPTIENAADALQQQTVHAVRNVEKLTLRAPITGRLLVWQAPPIVESTGSQFSPTTKLWSDPCQLGRQVSQGTMLGAICSSDVTAIVPLDDNHLASIATGTPVRIRPLAFPNTVLHGNVDSVVQLADLDASWRLLMAQETGTGQAQPAKHQNAHPPTTESVSGYAAVIRLPQECRSTPGTQVQVVFVLPSRTPLELASKWCQQNLRWLAD